LARGDCHTWTSHFSKSPTGSTDSRKKYKIILFILKIVLHLYKQNNNTMKKGILINVIEKSITPVLVEEGIQSIYNAIGCSTFEVVEYNNENDIYVDEEGLLSLTPESKFFQIKGYPQPICGNGLILGFDDETGESKDTTLSVMELIDKVLFLDMFEVQMKVRFPHLV
jgi:hypothetical protein